MSCVNKFKPEWIPSAYKTTGAGKPFNVNADIKQALVQVKPLVRHPNKLQKRKTTGSW